MSEAINLPPRLWEARLMCGLINLTAEGLNPRDGLSAVKLRG